MVNELQQENREAWGVVNEQRSISKIKRYSWKRILGKTLTEAILTLKKQGLNTDQTLEAIHQEDKMQKFVEENPKEMNNILKNLKISVSARFGESNTELKILEKNLK